METSRRYFRGVSVVILIVGFYFALVAANRSPASRGPTVADHPTMAASRKLLAPMGPALSQSNQKAIGPRAAVDAREFDFGTVEPFRVHQHVFKIQNTGDTPLTLINQGMTSLSLEVDVDPHTVVPGGTAKVTMSWDAGSNNARFHERAKLETNDPAARTLEFSLRGETRIVLAAEPPVLSAPRIGTTEPTTLTTKVVSPEWESFAVDVRPSLGDIRWNVTPLEAAELQKLKVKSGWLLSVTLPAGLPSGPVKERIQLTARPATATPSTSSVGEDIVAVEEVVREIPIQGAVPSRLILFGQDLTTLGSIDAGRLDRETGYNGVFTIKVNDTETRLSIAEVVADPAYIEARLEPLPNVASPGLYRLHVRIPPQTAATSYLGEKRGRLRISFDHPRIENLDLGVEFLVPTTFAKRTE